MTDQVVNILAGYLEEIQYIPAVEKVYYTKASGAKSDLDLLGVKDIPILVEEKSTQPFVRFRDIEPSEVSSIQAKLRGVFERLSNSDELRTGWKKRFKTEVVTFFPEGKK